MRWPLLSNVKFAEGIGLRFKLADNVELGMNPHLWRTYVYLERSRCSPRLSVVQVIPVHYRQVRHSI